MRRYNKLHNSNKISQMKQKMNENQYKEELLDDDYFFFNNPDELGSGTKKDPLRVMLTSRALMDNCQYLDRGVFQIDGTYRLCKNNFPWISNILKLLRLFLT